MKKLGLSENDQYEIKMYAHNEKISSIAEKSLTIIAILFGGLHNASRKQLEKFQYTNSHFTEYVMFGSMATFDNDVLTRLVVLAHKLAVRVELKPHSFRYVKLMFHERKRDGASYERHPTIEEVVEYWGDRE